MDLSRLTSKAKDMFARRGGAEAAKEDAQELKDIARSDVSMGDKAKAGLEALKDPGAPGEEGRPGGEQRRPGGEERRPGGEEPRPTGEQRRPTGEAPRPTGQEPRPTGEEPRPTGQEPRPTGEEPRPRP